MAWLDAKDPCFEIVRRIGRGGRAAMAAFCRRCEVEGESAVEVRRDHIVQNRTRCSQGMVDG